MIVGIPKEIKNNESRVAITPAGVETLASAGHVVIIETGAGQASGFSDEMYKGAGAQISNRAKEVFDAAEMIMKVKEPQPQEYACFKESQVLFTFLHAAAEAEMTRTLKNKKIVGISYDTVQLADNTLPLLAPMSEIAGRMAPQIGAQYLEKPWGGKGVLLGGVPGVPPAHVVIIGAGVVGTNAAKIAVGMGARVTVFDINPARLRYLDDIFGNRLETVMSSRYAIKEAVKTADLLIGAVLIPGAKAPHLVTEDMVMEMSPGSVIVDVAIDQGGCIQTIDRITTHSDPVYLKHGVVHYSVANMPGAVARTSTLALTNATLPYAQKLAGKGWKAAARDCPALAKGINFADGKITYQAIADALGMDYVPVNEVLS
ncbi:MAG: alanine dehydrogenase [Syntrophomonadaceae bacterium]|nr:alanine dehydrogenase [Syntrophomonadaceae bacterium]